MRHFFAFGRARRALAQQERARRRRADARVVISPGVGWLRPAHEIARMMARDGWLRAQLPM
jgi:hypothetical protein